MEQIKGREALKYTVDRPGTLCRRLPCGAHANAAATLMQLGAQDPGACEAMQHFGALAAMADMLICRAGACRLFCLLQTSNVLCTHVCVLAFLTISALTPGMPHPGSREHSLCHV